MPLLDIGLGTKECAKCCHKKSPIEFYSNKSCPDKLTSYCKFCIRSLRATADEKENIALTQKLYHARNKKKRNSDRLRRRTTSPTDSASRRRQERIRAAQTSGDPSLSRWGLRLLLGRESDCHYCHK